MHAITYEQPDSLLENFNAGMHRELPEFLLAGGGVVPFDELVVLNLGAGRKQIIGATPLDIENGWTAPILGQRDGSVDLIYAYHFLEHLDHEDAIKMLQECERVLKVGGLMNIVVPHWSSEAAHQDITHRTAWTESTFKNLFENPYYDGPVPREWKLRAHSVVIMGLVQRNLAVVAQLVKGE